MLKRQRWLMAAVVMSLAPSTNALHKAPSRAAGPVITLRLEAPAATKDEAGALDGLVTQFERANKEIKVNYIPATGDFETHLKVEFLTGNSPDVFALDMGWARDFIGVGALQPLNGYVARDKHFHPADFNSSLVRGFSHKVKVYAYPDYYSTLSLWYDRGMFTAKHLKHPPTDWKSFTRVACELTDAKQHIYGAALSPDAQHWFAFLKAFGGRVLNSTGSDVAINSRRSVEALNWYAGLIRRGCAEEPPSGSSDDQEFGQRHAAMTFATTSMAGYLKTNDPKLPRATAPLPTGPKGNGNIAFASGYAMSSHSKHKAAAWKLLRFLASKAAITSWIAQTGYLPGRRSVKTPRAMQSFIRGAAYSTPWAWPASLADNAFPEVGADIVKAASGRLTDKAAVADMGVWLKRYL